MKAMVVDKARSMNLQPRPEPVPGRGEVLIRVRACGVCHSDLHLLDGDFPFARYPVIPGHEVAGEVVALGEDVAWPNIGDRVGMPWLYVSCGVCDLCVAGEEVMCAKAEVTGVTKDGGFAEYMIAPAAFVAPIPQALSFEAAAPLMCAGLTVFNGLRNGGFKPGYRVAVLGLGGLGHLAVLYAKAMGGRVAVVSRGAHKKEQALALGAERYFDGNQADWPQQLMQWDGGANVVLATAPSAVVMNQAILGLAADGVLVVLGAAAEPIGAPAMHLIMGRRKIMGSPSGSRKDLRAALDFAAWHHIIAQTTPFPLEDAGKALESMRQGNLVGRAVLVL